MPERQLSRLLPPSSTPLARAVLDASTGIKQPVETLSSLYRPRAIASPLLPWLAWSVDVLAWPRRADETSRRGLVAGSWRLHQLQGTLAGYKQMAALSGAEVVRAITPPSKIFAGASLSREERNTFVARYPQLRIYPQRLSGQRVGALLAGLHAGARLFPVHSDAALRLAPQAFIYRDGSETPLQAIERTLNASTAEAVTVTEIRQPGTAGKLSFCGRPARWLLVSSAAQRIYRLSSATPYLDTRETLRHLTVTPGLAPLTLRYDWIAGLGTARGIHAGQYTARHLMPSTARERIYKRFWLFDPGLNVSRRVASQHCSGRLGMPPHHAEMLLRLTGRAHPRSARRFVHGYLCRSDQGMLSETLAALRQVMRVSDRIAIDTAVIKPALSGEHITAGAIAAGAWQ